MTATFYVGDSIQVMNTLPEKSVDLILTSPPFLALRSYLPSDHPDKSLEGGSQATPGAYIDWLLDVVEACARVLAPHGSLCFELGDTYSGMGGAGGDWSDSPLTTKARVAGGSDGGPTKRTLSDAWPQAKSLSLIPETFRFAMVYGRNPHTGRQTEPWRLRNVIRWVRPNPPVGALGDKFRPATSELMVFCKAKDRFFDLDAVREPHKHWDGTGQDPAQAKNARALTSYNEERSKVGNSSTAPASGRSNPNGAPPLDWWNVPLLEGEDETRVYFVARGIRSSDFDKNPREEALKPHPAGAPPLDWWNIPPGGYSGFTTWKTKVPVDPSTFDGFAGDIQRTVSADCPEHGDQSDRAPTGSHDGRGGIDLTRSPGNGGHLSQPLALDFAPTDQPPAPTPEDGSSDSPLPQSIPAATPRSKSSRKKVPVPATSPPDNASDRTVGRIDDTSSEPLSGGLHPDTPENRTSTPDQPSADPGTVPRTTDKPDQQSACTCSFYVEKANNTSHYAVWPPELLVKPIKAMCPERVCRRCGEARRRIVRDKAAFDVQPRLAAHIKERREAAGVTSAEINEWFGFKEIAKNWERTDPFGAAIPSANVWPILKERLDLSDDFDEVVLGERRWSESTIDYVDDDGRPSEPLKWESGISKGKGAHSDKPGSLTRVAPETFSDCGHDDYRPGLVLDPFAGSGTTLSVATGHGRDAIGIDLDERNYELSLDRVGPLILQRGEIRDGTGPPD